MTKNVTITPGSVQETLLIPLWGRATYSKIYLDLLNDPKAVEVIDNLDYDFSEVDNYYKGRKEYFGLIFLTRGRNFDEALKQYMKTYPNTTVVNLGCGLDTGFSRVDNGKIKWYDLDLPDVIEFRKQFIPGTSRSKYIGKSVLDYSWFDDLEFKLEKGIFFTAGGLFMYFEEEEISALLQAMAERFPGGELIFDISSKLGNKISNRRIKKEGTKEYLWYFSVGNPIRQISKWSPKLQVIDWFTFWARTPRNPKWDKRTLRLMKFADFLKLAKFVHVRFLQ